MRLAVPAPVPIRHAVIIGTSACDFRKFRSIARRSASAALPRSCATWSFSASFSRRICSFSFVVFWSAKYLRQASRNHPKLEEPARSNGETAPTVQTRISRPWDSRLICTASMSTCKIMTPASRTRDRKSTRLNSSHLVISYAVFCLKKKQHMVFTLDAGVPRPPVAQRYHSRGLERRRLFTAATRVVNPTQRRLLRHHVRHGTIVLPH